jgi:hypothetical protein
LKSYFEYCESKAEEDLVKPAKGDIKMADFKKQIMEDIAEYQQRFPNIANIMKDEWAFNYWVLDNLFSEEEELIEGKIVDYDDKGIDCFVWHEDRLDLYLIQNKFYSEGTQITNDYVQNDFLTRALGALQKGTYKRSAELQGIYSKFSGEEDFCLHFHLYVTSNSSVSDKVYAGIAKFNQDNAAQGVDAKIFNLNDIQELYYKEPLTDTKSFKFDIKTINKGTELSINNDAYKMTLALDAKYLLTPVITIYKLYKEALKQKYPLFDENIREYLGSTVAVNKKIVATLRNPDERANFFFYNNGITMIVDDISAPAIKNNMRTYEVSNPQIVNGCQTVSTIYETLDSLPEDSLEKDFSNTFVMVKILKIPAQNPELKGLYRNIVTYNNSQNAITEKSFIAVQDVFRHLQHEFEKRGFLVCIKQSDENTFAKKYKTATHLLDNNSTLLSKFKITGKKKTKDFRIKLEKLLQVYTAFISLPQDAIQNKSRLLVDQSAQHKNVIDFIKSNDTTSNDLINLYLLYLRANQEKLASPENKIPNPFYLIYCFSRYECRGGDASQISAHLNSAEEIDTMIKRYIMILRLYYNKWKKKNDGEYNDMIKSSVDTVLLDECKDEVDVLMAIQI